MPYEPLQPEGLRLLPRDVIAMPQSHARILVHLVFSTKNREPLILPAASRSLSALQAEKSTMGLVPRALPWAERCHPFGVQTAAESRTVI